jgi:hypothetical protein
MLVSNRWVTSLVRAIPLIAMLLCAAGVHAQTLTTVRVASGLTRPVFATSPTGDFSRLFIVERKAPADILILDLATKTLNFTPFLDLDNVDTVVSEGLLGMAFHPDYATNGKFYVNYVADGGTAGITTISEFEVSADPDLADESSVKTIIMYDQPQGNHNGGWIGFGPDGYLYIASGDGGGQHDDDAGHTVGTGNGQDITANLLGKMLRIDVDSDDFPADATRNYAIPPDNPFVAGSPLGDAGDDEIWAYGLRNPWRASFDRATGDLYIADVGQGTLEELDFQQSYDPSDPAQMPGMPDYPGGRNYGWRLREGTIATPTGGICPNPPVDCPEPPDHVNPIYEYTHGSGDEEGFSVTGGYVYRGPILGIQGHYFFADFQQPRIWSFRFDGSDPGDFDGTNVMDFTVRTTELTPDVGTNDFVAGFGEDGLGNLYIVDHGTAGGTGEVFVLPEPGASTTLGAGALCLLLLNRRRRGATGGLGSRHRRDREFRIHSIRSAGR